MTPRAALIARHYIDMGVWNGWTMKRVEKACRLLGETMEELAASCCISNQTLWMYRNHGRVPGPVALLFHMREQEFLRSTGLKQD